jgi:hypothetical protein
VGYTYKTIYDFMEQAKRDAREGQIPIVNCKMDRHGWLCVMDLEDFIEIWKRIPRLKGKSADYVIIDERRKDG